MTQMFRFTKYSSFQLGEIHQKIKEPHPRRALDADELVLDPNENRYIT
ncbi:MAG: hypothetical protein HC862_04440 [Scytonema sp. RU_4_4]|nr:hypothetical protein [Scytonema sp. RU_4_4]NJR73464.1 hypothetical protein [Scytonema sp. CRU_2_7]